MELPGDEWTGPMRTVWCVNPECTNQGAHIEVPDNGNQVICGPCGAILADADPTEEPEPEEPAVPDESEDSTEVEDTEGTQP